MKTTSDSFRMAGGVVAVNWREGAGRAELFEALSGHAVATAPVDLGLEVAQRTTGWPAVAAGGLMVEADAAGFRVLDPARRLAQWISADGRRATFEFADGAALPVQERATPFRFIFQRWLHRRRQTMLHAAAVGLAGGGAVLLVARGGGGKSNTTLACLTAGPMQLLGEDLVAVDAAPAPRVWSLYATAKLHAADLPRYPALAPDGRPGRDEVDAKVVLSLGRRHAGRWGEGLPLRAILVLKITGGPVSRIVPAGAADAVKEMLTSLLMVLPDMRRPLFEAVTALAAGSPVYRLELGGDPRQLAGVVHDFLRREGP